MNLPPLPDTAALYEDETLGRTTDPVEQARRWPLGYSVAGPRVNNGAKLAAAYAEAAALDAGVANIVRAYSLRDGTVIPADVALYHLALDRWGTFGSSDVRDPRSVWFYKRAGLLDSGLTPDLAGLLAYDLQQGGGHPSGG